MNKKILVLIACLFLTASCVTIPKATVSLSRAIETDIKAFHQAHSNIVKLFYSKLKSEVNSFIDNVYAPDIIHEILQSELMLYQNGEPSLYGIILLAGTDSSQHAAKEALSVMVELQKAVYSEIASKRRELLEPIENEETEALNALNLSYQNTILAGNVLTNYLISAQKVKEAQKEAYQHLFDAANLLKEIAPKK